uniref:Probable RuBisCO transcriptional regulator n=1 Tax=Amicula sp. isolate GU52X-4 cfCalB7 TaxID=3003489 RepID=A0A9E8Z1Q3_9STRA|nr:rubisco operon transcription regulator [Amicula sp. isolate GU52X-4 cfCalB7]
MLPFTLQQLRILKAVAMEENFTKAAEGLYLSQPALSKQLQVLEKNFDSFLVDRENNKIFLTENGQILLEYSERILALCEESCRTLIDLKNGDRGNLTIGTSQTTGTYLMPRILALFNQTYPQMSFKVRVDSTRFIINKVINKEIDIAIVGGEIPSELKKDLQIQTFINDELNLIVPVTNHFIKKQKITKEDLYNLNFITLNSNSTIRMFIDKILVKNKIDVNQLNIRMELNSIEGIKTAVSVGLGASFVSSFAIEKEIKLNTIKIVDIEGLKIRRKLSIVSNLECYKSKAFNFFYQELIRLKASIED